MPRDCDDMLDRLATLLEEAGADVVLGEWSTKALPLEARREFTEWFLAELERQATLDFVSARERFFEVLRLWVQRHPIPFSTLEYRELQTLMMDVSNLVTLDLVGIAPDTALVERLLRLGFTRQQIAGFPGMAFRFASLRDWMAEHPNAQWPQVKRAATMLPLTRIEQVAIDWATTRAAQKLRPIFLLDGSAITEALLEAERAWVRAEVSGAMAVRQDPLALARQMFKERRDIGFRDWERVARTEIADAFAHGAFIHNVGRGKFAPESEVVRVPRSGACKICLALFTNADGSLRRYRVADLLAETTPLVDVGVRTVREYRATIGVPHPNDLCSPWILAGALESDTVRQRYRTHREGSGLEVAVA